MSKRLSKKELIKNLNLPVDTHKVWHKFSNWITRTYGKDLWGKWQYITGKNPKSKRPIKIKYRSFNDFELSKRLVGHEVMCKVEKYVEKYCPEIKIIPCDDATYSGADILLIPHPKHGITVMFIPQCTEVQNQFFLYNGHYKELMKALREMKQVYKGSL